MKTPDGRTLAIDNKFGPDEWGTKKGMGGDQRQDQNAINKQHNPSRDDVENLQLNEDNCECKGKNKPDAQTVEQLNLVYYPNIKAMQAMQAMQARLGGVGSTTSGGKVGARIPMFRFVLP